MQPAKAADAARVAKTPRTVLLTVSSFDRQPIEARAKGLDDSHGLPRGDLPPCSSHCQSWGARQLRPPSPSCPRSALSGDGPCAPAVTERMKETVSFGNSGTAGHVQPEARANTSDVDDRQCSLLRPSERSMMITMPGLAAE